MFLQFLGSLILISQQSPSPSPREEHESVSEIEKSVRARPTASVSISDGWTIVQFVNKKDFEIWSFTPASHPSHPSAVQRKFRVEGEQVSIEMTVFCEAEEVYCDQLYEEFDKLNKELSSTLN